MFIATCCFLHKSSLSRCWHMNCDPAVLTAAFPPSVLPDFNSTEVFTDEYAAAMQTHPGCAYQPVSSDGWFTAHTALRSGNFQASGFLEKPMAFRLEGAASPLLLRRVGGQKVLLRTCIRRASAERGS